MTRAILLKWIALFGAVWTLGLFLFGMPWQFAAYGTLLASSAASWPE